MYHMSYKNSLWRQKKKYRFLELKCKINKRMFRREEANKVKKTKEIKLKLSYIKMDTMMLLNYFL